MSNIELNFVVTDSRKAATEYEHILGAKILEGTDLELGLNEVILNLSGMQIHLLDANSQYQLFSPSSDSQTTMWVNITVDNIQNVWNKALETGWQEIMPLTYMEKMGISNACIKDNFGYVWMLHQIHKDLSFKEREEILKTHKVF